ncbi:DNA-binding protein [Corynebacterium diphtheriae]|uniref:DNA-binding protein n=1 Tax=Corynebacterium diphtheriae TaxID=1717 RepID=UPI000B4A82E1|nr:DNA-binding protein [Corynebacterium diphtheriae]MBG9296498.1 DNA-binding protein [Corynebacterium diphtheriae bv. gravis]OWN70149.1 DNA-binding protein [Corynebacterium diphtheriae bv. gravis]RKW91337.1 DNA-binding protein [Corynebacterium diphtheriae]RKX01546.1 DNA-binding protein [Corynebacterium diphtheriae]RLP08688.1 DNA-binding protein [Corynebacterium diphtheriae]
MRKDDLKEAALVAMREYYAARDVLAEKRSIAKKALKTAKLCGVTNRELAEELPTSESALSRFSAG